MHKEVNREALQRGSEVANLTAAEIKKAIDKLLAQLNELKKIIRKSLPVVHGKQSLKELSAQNVGLSSMELKDPNLWQLN
ncbi:MAG: PcfB family protein [Oscillospiraceae bacterium]|nr:PcfB family protein [Oscillospiraceae bacterium]